MKKINLIIAVLIALFLGSSIGNIYDSNAYIVGGALFVASLARLAAKTPQGVASVIAITDTSYAGEVLETFISHAMTSYQTLMKGCINILPGIKKKATVPILKVDSFIQAQLETPVNGGNIDIDARTLDPKDFMGYLEFNPRKFEQHWLAVQMNPKLMDAELPQTAEAAIIAKVLQQNGNYMEQAVWRSEFDAAAITTAQGSGLGPGDNNLIFFDGLLRGMYLDADVTKIATPVALTAANIFAKFDLVKAAAEANEAVYNSPGFKFLANFRTAQIFGEAQKAQANKGVDVTQQGVMKYDGKPIVSLPGIEDNTIIACVATSDVDSNIWAGVNDADEDSYLKIMPLQANSEKWFMKMLFKMDVNHGLGEEIVVYTTKTYI